MKIFFKCVFMLVLVGLIGRSPVFAQTNDPGIQKRMDNQEQRIDQGIQRGRLTPKEAGKLEAEEAKIKQDELRMKSDGNLTPKERRRLNKEQDKSSRDIYRLKHNQKATNVKNVKDPGIQQSMDNQEQRIDQGVRSGELTPKEAGKLEAEQAKIKQTEERMKSDGNLTIGERERLQNMQDRAGSDINRQKHDRQKVRVR
jgi:hypothetical protein